MARIPTTAATRRATSPAIADLATAAATVISPAPRRRYEVRSRLGVVKVSPLVAGPGSSGTPRYTLEGLSGVKRVGAAEGPTPMGVARGGVLGPLSDGNWDRSFSTMSPHRPLHSEEWTVSGGRIHVFYLVAIEEDAGCVGRSGSSRDRFATRWWSSSRRIGRL